MQISVAMATYNGQRFIRDQLDSIAHQTRPPDQLVVSDDGSSDDTVPIVRAFADRAPFEVVILRNENRLGSSGNFFRAIEKCSGDLITPCDQDDVWRPTKLARTEIAFQASPRVTLVSHAVRVVDDHLRVLPSRWGRIRLTRRLRPGSMAPFSYSYSGFTLAFRSIFVRKLDVSRRPRAYARADAPLEHDVWLNLVCRALGETMLLSDTLALYRRHASNVTRDGAGTSPHHLVRHAFRLQTEVDAYRDRAALAREYAAYLDTLRPLAHQLGDASTEGLKQAVTAHTRFAKAMERRAAAYTQRRTGRRAIHLLRHAAHGDYSTRTHGGLGALSLARDFTIGLSRAAHDSPPVQE